LAVLTLLLGAITLVAGPARAESTTITQGSVTWGVKQSWRTYIGETGISTSGGVTRDGGGAFVWPVVSGDYDSESNRLELQLAGTTHFTAHEGALDLTISSPRLVIDGDDPQLFAEVVSKSETTGQLVDYGEIAIVSLALESGAPDSDGGLTAWSPLDASLTAKGFEAFSRNYPAGTPMDPVSATYTGPGGKPTATQESWTPAGSLVYEQTGSHAVSDATSILPDPARGLVHVATPSSLRAYDIDTWEPVGTPLAVGNASYPGAVLDQDAGAVIMNVSNKLTAYRWHPDTESYDATVLYSGVPQALAYDRFGHRVLVPDPSTGLRTYAFTDGAWVPKVYPLAGIPSGRAGVTADATGRVVIVAADFLPVIVTISGDTAQLTELPGDYTDPDASQAMYQYPTEVFAPSTGGFMLTNYTGKIYRVREADGVYTRDATVRRTGLGAVLRATADVSTDTWYLADNTLQTVTAVTAEATGTIAVKDLGYYVLYPIGLVAVEGKVYAAATRLGGSGEGYGIRTFEEIGTSPAFTTQPGDTTATIGIGATTDDVTFSAAATGDPATELQWQQRAASTGRFSDIPEATGTSLAVSATAATNGRQYRVIASNAAGQLASDVATLTVESAPSTVIDLADQTVEAGTDATFEVMPSGNPYPAITWQRRVGGFWQTIDADDEDVTINGGRLTIPATNIDQSGTLLRARLANSVASIYSRTATLTIEAPSTAKQTISAGRLDWGVKKSFRDYVAGPIAHGSVTVSDGATKKDDGTFAFPVSEGVYDPAVKDLSVAFGGTVRFLGHNGQLELVLSNPELTISRTAGSLTATVTSRSLETGQSVDYGRVALADLDTARGLTVGGGKVTFDGVPATLTAVGAPAFGGFYSAGAALDELGASLDLGGEVVDRVASTTTVSAGRASLGYGSTTKVTVRVASPAGTPTGGVDVTVGGRTTTAPLVAGSATVNLPSGLQPGRYAVTAAYGGTDGIAASSGTTSLSVTKATPRVAATLARSSIKNSQRARLRVVVTIPGATTGVHALGRIVVRDGAKVIARSTLRSSANGKVTVVLPRLKKGKHRIRVTLAATSSQVTARSARRTLHVR
jgi:hypothetical protein